MIIRRPTVQDCFIPEQYTSSPEIIKNCLQEVLSEGMIATQVSAPVENEDMTKKQRENIIKKHMEQYTTNIMSQITDGTHFYRMRHILVR